MPGLILTLNDKGWLELSYLGTEQPKVANVAGDRKEIDYEKGSQDYVKTMRRCIIIDLLANCIAIRTN